MYSYSTQPPDAKQFMQSSPSDVFVVPESSCMQVDEVVDNLANPSTPMKLGSVSPMVQSGICIPDKILRRMYEDLERFFKADDEYDDMEDGEVEQCLVFILISVKPAFTKMKKYLPSSEEFLQNVRQKGEKEFIDSLRDMARKKSWRDLLENDVFRKRIPERLNQSQWSLFPASQGASVKAWSSIFKGRAADVLLKSISSYLSNERIAIYTRHTSIVNSSGTGKSRMVDELAKKIITVPMCLRRDGSQGFPPSDYGLRNFLMSNASPNNQADVAKKLDGFMYSLLTVLLRRLEAIASGDYGIPTLPPLSDSQDRAWLASLVKQRQALLASTFRDLMTMGQSFQRPNEYRERFYDDIIGLAVELAKGSRKSSGSIANGLPQHADISQGIGGAGKKLCRFIDPDRLLDSRQGSRWPLVILAFDESHILTDTPETYCDWTLFSKLRRTLRGIVDQAIFTLFLSTAGRSHLFLPEIESDPSRRVTDFMDPVTEISFDNLAFTATKDTVTLDRVVQTDWISHLGRPLFGAYNDVLSRDENELFLFAQQKLLNGKTSLTKKDGPGSLACLSVRFALEFNSDSISREVACTQVERHMRLCIAATTGFERLVTLAGSEPLLAEAASQLTHDSKVNPVSHLAYHPDLDCIDRGRRGELVAELIIMQARDKATRNSNNGRSVSVCDFIRELLPESSYDFLQSSRPTSWREGEDLPFTETFEDYAMWFNHVIRVEDRKMINSEFLWIFITRGAMISCPHNQEGVDIVLPICLKNENLSPDNVSAILIQVKNAKEIGCKIDKTILDQMDPLRVGLFNEGSRKGPVIRMVFALASDDADVLFPTRRDRFSEHFDEFTAFDIWCAGLMSFKNTRGDFDAYTKLLDRSLHSHDAFDLGGTTDRHMDSATKTSRAHQRQGMAALIRSDIGHRQIHVEAQVQ